MTYIRDVRGPINTIFGSDRYKQTNSHDIEQESSDVIELETNENEEMVIEDDLESSINKDISEKWKTVLKEWSEGLISEEESVKGLESLFKMEELEETEALSFNELLTGLKHPADDPMEKCKLVNLFDFKFSTPSSIKNLMKIQDDSR
ncbi:hypothetical protein F8M41_026470 [Gigaspora margarita]|uniref:Uncharacterized protein n=1 Tax=Gigaspora margarita TaxID=4874 RepID=A0A8H3XIQ8_GIGMA|nr:hypothetical protein F8M41_026470 [Gigaspora margarita]